MYEALIATIKEVYPEVHYDKLGYVFPPYVIIPVVSGFFILLKRMACWQLART